MSQVLIICGQPRSGTTLLAHLCNSHPQLAITTEFRQFDTLDQPLPTHIARLYKRIWQRVTFRPALRRPRWWAGLHNASYTAAYILLSLRRFGKPVRLADVHQTLAWLFPNKAYVGDKFPPYLLKLEEFVGRPDVRVIIIYRDVRAVVDSSLRKVAGDWANKPWATYFDTPEKVARSWVRAIEKMEQYDEQVFCLQYESLVAYPATETKRLAEWLGITPHGFDLGRIQPTQIHSSASGLTPEQTEMVLQIAGPTLQKLGYRD